MRLFEDYESDDTVTVTGLVLRETERAILLKVDAIESWVPRSAITNTRPDPTSNDNLRRRVTMKRWKAEQAGFD